ncbi:phosphatidic acid-preferring phospholipase A1 [Moesziomyces antarcticus T-34]|uniref:Phosphatidic acid-preferring phospholipase A1 n=1 Tax=Pseudozyma antarctica (strain T-34) TaxID=1151754 RepID=M9M0W4_PSEA3|nr:phosphatidic acid-preferring phospholipase A1 [Moesziomyces antarcticus T-34]
MGNNDEATISTGEEDKVKTVKASDQSSKQRRADFIRQASQPLVKRTRSNTRSKSSSSPPKTREPSSHDIHETEEEHQPDGIAEEEEEDDDQGPALHWRWVRTTESGKGWESFSVRDSRCLESAWKSWTQQQGGSLELPDLPENDGKVQAGEFPDSTQDWQAPDPDEDPSPSKVAVAQDRLYDADIADFSMSPVFWRGPKLRITRASWFFESSKLTPCSTALAAELESHFQTLRPWFSSYTDELKSSVSLGSEAEAKLKCSLKTLKNSYVIFQGPRLARLYNEGFSNRLSKQFFTAWSGEHSGGQLLIRGYQTLVQLNEAKRGGAITKKTVRRPKSQSNASEKRASVPRASGEGTQDLKRRLEEALNDEQSDAVVVDDVATMDMDLSEHSSVKQDSPAQAPRSLPTSASQASLNVDRTHIEATPSKIGAKAALRNISIMAAGGVASTSAPANELLRSVASRLGVWNGAAQVSSSGEQESDTDSHQGAEGTLTPAQQDDISESFKEAQRRIQDDLPAPATKPAETAAAVLEKQDQDATQDPEEGEWDDPDAFDDEEERREDRAGSERPPELLLAIHGIGQRLAGEWKSFDFTLAINTFRALLQSRIETNKPPSDIGGRGLGGLAAQRHVQILPVHWQTGFHQMEDDEKWADHDSDAEDPDSMMYDNGLELEMDHIFGDDGIPIVRTLVKDVLMDIPMYLSQHKSHVIRSAMLQANRQYRLFAKRNPDFEAKQGRVHIVAHSLGTVISSDLLSQQPDRVPLTKDLTAQELREASQRHLLFNTHSFFAVGAPVALFFVLHRAQLIARSNRVRSSRFVQDKPGVTMDREGKYGCLAITNFYNIWNQFDPVATRASPCVDVEYAKLLKPVPLSKVVRSVLRADPEAENHDIAEDGGSQSFGYGSNNESDAGVAKRRAAAAKRTKGFFGSWSRKAGEAASSSLGEARAAAAARGKSKASTAGGGADDDQTGDEGAPRSSLDVSETEGDKEARDKVENLRSKIAAKALEEEARKEERERKASQERSKGISDKRRARAEARLRALNPLHRIDYYMPVEGYSLLSSINQYAELMTAHMSYWTKTDFADFLITQLMADDERLERSLDYKDVEGWE